MLAGPQAALDVIHGVVGTDVAGCHVGDGIASGQCGVDVGGGGDAYLGVEPRKRRGVLTVLVRRGRDDS
jgi:hypothetical protein